MKPLALLLFLAMSLSAATVNWTNGVNQTGYNPGDVIQFYGTNTAGWTVTNSGAVGSPITFQFMPNAKFSAGTIGNGGSWIYGSGISNWVFDGQGVGVIELTNNGTGLGYSNATYGIYLYGSPTNITIKNLTIRKLYQRSGTNEGNTCATDGILINCGGGMTVSNVTFSDMQDCFDVQFVPSFIGLNLTACTFTNFNHGITIGNGVGGPTNPILQNISITHNSIRTGDRWEGSGDFHRDPMIWFQDAAMGDGSFHGNISNIVFAFNFCKSGENPQTATAGSAFIYGEGFNDANLTGFRLYNNVFVTPYPLTWSSGSVSWGAGGANAVCANNTAVTWQTNGSWSEQFSPSIGGTNTVYFNNISLAGYGGWYSVSPLVSPVGVTTGNYTNWFGAFMADYNVWATNIYNGNGDWLVYVAGTKINSYNTLADLFAASGWEGHSIMATPQLDANYSPLSSDTVAVGHGTNLTALAVAWGIPDLTNDFAGNPRPATGNWTIGAYNAATNAPTPPATGGSGGWPFGIFGAQ